MTCSPDSVPALSPEIVRTLLAERFPPLRPERVKRIDEGEGRTFEVNGTYIFRFATDELSAQKLVCETALLRAISSDLPLSVPVIEFIGEKSERSPLSFVGHRKIQGRSGEEARPDRTQWPAIARQMGEFLSALHLVAAATGERCGLKHETMQQPASLLRSTLRYSDVIRRELRDLSDASVTRYLSGDVVVPPPSPPDAFVCNGDIKGEHIIVSERAARVVGVIDWSDCCLSDRLLDFTGLMIWLGEAFVYEVLEQYAVPTDEHFFDRVRFYSRCFALGHLGQRLAGRSDAPLELLRTQAHWAFA